ncbi:MAG: FAD-binding oxidoreductase [Chloroflexi bacterium]|nr:FAD-binding oxidoreductase [Chloroflexota bacterium]
MEIASRLAAILGEAAVITDRERMLDYLVDETASPVRPQPADEVVVARPASAQEVASLLRLANDEGIPVFPRGGGTGLCGGAVPTENGIVLSLERMNGIALDKDNLMATVEAGATLGDLMAKAEEAGLFFPPHPGDESAQIGGLVACNAGGSRAVKYGVMRSYVKGVEAVLPDGDILRLGGKLLKDNAGYDLMQLLIGSEGTLAVVTSVILRLFPPLGASATMVIPYEGRHDAIDSVPEILRSGVMPLAIEYVDRSTVEVSAANLGLEWPCRAGKAYLMVIVDGESVVVVRSHCQHIYEICAGRHALEPAVGETRKDQERVLKIRSNIYLALKGETADILDMAVPPASMGKLMDAVDDIATQFGVTIPMYGHAGDGNLHAHLIKDLARSGPSAVREAKTLIYKETVKLGGTITAEHGLGKTRVPDMHLSLDETKLALMRRIKKVFDPRGILNPGCAISPE